MTQRWDPSQEQEVIDGDEPSGAPESVPEVVSALVGGASWGYAVRVGLVGAALAIYLCLVGIVSGFDARSMIQGVISLGQTFLLLTLFAAGYLAARGHARGLPAILAGALGGALCGAGVTLLVVVGAFVNLRVVFAPAAAALYDIVTFGLGVSGAWIPTVIGAGLGAIAGGLALMPRATLRAATAGFLAVLLLGLFAGLLRTPMLGTPLAGVARFLFSSAGLTVAGAAITFIIVAAASNVPRSAAAVQPLTELSAPPRRLLTRSEERRV